MRSRQRRQVLRAALGAAGAALVGAAWRGQSPLAQESAGALRETALRGELIQLSGAGGNIVVLGGSSGVTMVDSGAPGHEQSIASFVTERFARRPVDLLFNTHWHLEHTGGNETFGRAGAKIVAHENTRLWMSTEFFVDWQERTYEPRPAAARPTDTFYSSDRQPIALAHSGEAIEYGLLREAHTDGDMYVRFREHNVIVAGGAVTVGEYPVVDYITGGAIGGLVDATQRLIDLCDAQTLIVPAVGPAQRRSDLEAQRDMVATVISRLQMYARRGQSVEEMLAAGITAEFDGRWGANARRFVTNAYNSLWGISG